MKYIYIKIKNHSSSDKFYWSSFLLLAIFALSLISCKKFIDIDAPRDSLIPATVFKNDELATSAVLGIYQQMTQSNYASGGHNSIAVLCGLTSDELIGYNSEYRPIYQNQITPNTNTLSSIWNAPYKIILDANSVLEGLSSSNSMMTPPVKSQLQGEAYFLRAFTYFYLVNLFGAVPLHLTSDYKVNSKANRESESEIYDQIIKDLKIAESLLKSEYITVERVRPNKFTARALLSRIYLFQGDWVNAERYSTLVISEENLYTLSSLNEVFLKNSSETIWQLMPPQESNTAAGNLFILTSTPLNVSLRQDFVKNSFEQDDSRKTSWIKSIVSGEMEYYFPFKYKVKSATTVTEYSMVFRLAEQLLIRAEARAQQNNLKGAIDDLDKIRMRAGLSLIGITNPEIQKNEMLEGIAKERKVELFCEWGDRWFDLKRGGKLTSTLSSLKTGWKSHYTHFPIPYSEIAINTNINQNDGY